MSEEPTDQEQHPPASEEELRARVEEQVRKLRVQDLLLETAVSVLNLSARRIGKEDERDLEQARVGIEAVRGLCELLDPEPQRQVRAALSELQMRFAMEARGGGQGPAEKPAEGPPGEPRPRPSGLWTPPGT